MAHASRQGRKLLGNLIVDVALARRYAHSVHSRAHGLGLSLATQTNANSHCMHGSSSFGAYLAQHGGGMLSAREPRFAFARASSAKTASCTGSWMRHNAPSSALWDAPSLTFSEAARFPLLTDRGLAPLPGMRGTFASLLSPLGTACELQVHALTYGVRLGHAWAESHDRSSGVSLPTAALDEVVCEDRVLLLEE